MQCFDATIAVSSFNHVKFIEETIGSILKQSHPSFELLVIDDGSTDGTIDVLKKLQKNRRFDLRLSANNGLTYNLNRMLEMAKGKYFLPFGSDDVMPEDRLSKQISLMEIDDDIVLSGGNIIAINEDGKQLPKQKLLRAESVSFEDLFLGNGVGIPAPSMMFSTDKLRAVGGFNENIRLEDVYIALKCAESGFKVVLSDDLYAYYRVHGNNTYKNLLFMYTSMKDTLECFNDHPLYKKALANYINSSLVKASSRNKEVYRIMLKDLDFKYYNLKTIKSMFRYLFLSEG